MTQSSFPKNTDAQNPNQSPPRLRFGALAPFAIFALLAGLFIYALSSDDPSIIPSVLIGKPIPEFQLPPLKGLKATDGKEIGGFSSETLKQGQVSIVNVWASWCGPCRLEHPHIISLAKRSGAPLYGLNHKDTPEAANRFLQELGNPFNAVGVDTNGRVSIDWGVYGVPETFIVNGKGEIVHKHVGPVSAEMVETKLLPIIEKTRKADMQKTSFSQSSGSFPNL